MSIEASTEGSLLFYDIFSISPIRIGKIVLTEEDYLTLKTIIKC